MPASGCRARGPRICRASTPDRRARAGPGGDRGDHAGCWPANSVDLGFVVLDDEEIDAFRREVYAATRAVPPGSTATYGEIARVIGRPDGARDVGAALARNPTPIIVPCHRVVGANGKLTGFSAPGGLETKRRMLAWRARPGSASRSSSADPRTFRGECCPIVLNGAVDAG